MKRREINEYYKFKVGYPISLVFEKTNVFFPFKVKRKV
jgi:hypothetical protein